MTIPILDVLRPRVNQCVGKELGSGVGHQVGIYSPAKLQQKAYVERFNSAVPYERLSQNYCGNLKLVQQFATNRMWA